MKYKKLPDKILPFLWLFLKKYKYKFFVYIFLSIFVIDASFMFLQPYLMKIFFDKIQDHTITITNGLILIVGISISDFYLFIKIIVDRLEFCTITRTIEDIRTEVFRYLLKQSMNFFNTNYSGEIVSKIESITDSLKYFVSATSEMLKNLFLLFCLSFTMFLFNKWLGFLLLIWFILYCFVCYYYVLIKLSNQSKLIQDNQNKIVAFVTDDFMNIKNIKAFSNEKYENNILIKMLVKKFRKMYLETKYRQIVDFLFFLLNFLVISIIMVFGIIQFKYNLITFGSFVFLLDVLRRFVMFSGGIRYCISDFKDVIVMQDSLNLITTDIEIEDKENAKELEITGGKIVFKNVNFGYNKK